MFTRVSDIFKVLDLFCLLRGRFSLPKNYKMSKSHYDQERVDQWAQKSSDWLRQEYGDRIVSATLHLDESTPHIHAHLVPLDEKGKLNCRALFGGSRYRLSKLQDSYAAAVQSLGLERGVKGSRANYKTIAQYYTDVNRDSRDLDLEQQLPQPEQLESATQYRERVISIFCSL